MANYFRRCGFSHQFDDDELRLAVEYGELLARLAPCVPDNDEFQAWRAASMPDNDDDYMERWRRDEATGEWIHENGLVRDFKRNDDPDWPLSHATRRSPE